jgi:DNA-binding response OmpR family regulator
MASSELFGLRILFVEDDPIIALDVATTLAAAGALVLGPAHTVSQAMRLIGGSAVDVAVLDFRLEAETVSPVAKLLTAKGTPYLFCTSSRGRPELAHPGVPILDKPTRPEQLVAAIRALTNKR